MSKLDTYLRSIERFGAAGAMLTSGQAVTLKFPTGDRHATQVTPHDQLVILVREVAPPAVLDQIDAQRPARFEVDSEGRRYAISVSPRLGAWTVGIEAVTATPAASPPAATMRTPGRAASAPVDAGGEMEIERGQYAAGPISISAPPASSGSALLDGLTTTARASRATDIYLSAGNPALVRTNGELAGGSERTPLDSELLSRELGVVAPPEARAAWSEGGSATFAYGDGAGRVRATVFRDQRGPGAALRLLHGEPPPLGGLGLGADVAAWLGGRGLILVGGPSGTGKTTALAALVRTLGEKRRGVVCLEQPIEIVQIGPSISQRSVGEHVQSHVAGVAAAMREGVDAIALGAVSSSDAALALVEAVAGGHLVLATVTAPSGRAALELVIDLLPVERRDLARALCAEALLGTLSTVVGRGGARSIEVTGRGSGS